MTLTCADCTLRPADAILLAGRALLAVLFLNEGVTLLADFPGAAAYMGKAGLPSLLLLPTAVLQLGGGMQLALGWHTRLSALGLALFCLATASLFHADFDLPNELLQFEKDLAIAGGLFALVAHGAGALSADAFRGSARFGDADRDACREAAAGSGACERRSRSLPE